MISIEDYEKEDGNTDWPKYREAQKAVGEICSICERYLFSLKGYSVSRKCGECEDLYDSKTLSHSSYIRCPSCGEFWRPEESEDFDVLCDGEHDVPCDCGNVFEVGTHVTFIFESPEMKKNSNKAGE